MVSRNVPAAAMTALNSQETGDFALVFLTIDHPILTTPIRVVSDAKDFELDGNTFQGFQFEITLLTDNEEPPRAELAFQNVDRLVTKVLHDIDEPCVLKIEVIWSDQFTLTADPRTEIGTAARMYTAENLYLTNVEVDALFVRGTLRTWNYTQELWPGMMATKTRLPGLFR